MNSYELKHPPIFIGGVQRAGTTLLVKMLSKNTAVSFLPQETHLFPLLWNTSGHLKGFRSPEELSDYLAENLPAVNYGWVNAKDFLAKICDTIKKQQFLPATTEDLLAFILKLWELEQPSDVIVGEKTPAHVYYARKKLKEFPKCKMVLMCRDPRAAALSELIKLQNNTRIERDFSVFTFIVRWATAVAVSKQLAKRDQVIFIRYEDLIIEPETTLKKVTDFLGIAYHKEMLDVGVTNSSFQDTKQKGISFNEANLSRWETELPSDLIALINYHLKEEMNNLGYAIKENAHPNIKQSQLLKQRIKLAVAKQVALVAPSLFHHLNRNKKYRN
ncbi:MAG: sulfotransferase [Chitinophagales bacterium]